MTSIIVQSMRSGNKMILCKGCHFLPTYVIQSHDNIGILRKIKGDTGCRIKGVGVIGFNLKGLRDGT